MKWMLNSDDRPDAMLTFGAISLAVILFKFLFSEISVGPVAFGQLDAGVIAAILTPTLGAYCTRRYTDAVVAKKDKNDTPN